MKEQRIAEILNSIQACSKGTYKKVEALPEEKNLENELVKLVFAEEHAEYANYRLYDVLNHFRQKNEELGHVADEELANFEAGCNDMVNEIKGRISGERGERKVFGTLENLKVNNRILKNVELTEAEERTEIDAAVITPRAIFIVEVKNTGRDIFIDEKGDYYRVGRYNNLDCHLGEKMECKERMLRNALRNQGIADVNIEKIVVFTNNQIQIANEYKGLDICFLCQLCYRINSYKGNNFYSAEQMIQIEAAIESERCKEEYPLDIDVENFKNDFAVLMATLEEASNMELDFEAEISDAETPEERVITPSQDEGKHKSNAKYLRYACNIAAVASVTLFVSAFASAVRR